MTRSLSVLLLSALVLTSCGTVRDSRLNPMNWFGRSTAQPVATEGEVNPLIPRRRASILRPQQDDTYRGQLIGDVTELLVERRPGGAVIRATGVADYQGVYDVRLVKVDEESDAGTLTLDFRALQLRGPQGRPASRTVTAAVWLTDNELGAIRTIRVKSARTVRTSRR
ncbi:hypothetical protein [Pseudoponticoccus marisrubri]|uniref:Lipoprotein n=1 Tax=Pseudoponticoccus marisrubri TaxID=1685382 RepID=A0A0W7WLY8_9RHOB|nr:hypothetical protein [Pseudoponticoccus marisrubri]KUF11609.1 hypothetical protein AVJ23_07585 [Pseudoponticoccus marisrubri]